MLELEVALESVDELVAILVVELIPDDVNRQHSFLPESPRTPERITGSVGVVRPQP